MTAPASFRRLILFCGPQPWGKQAASRLISSSKLPADQVYWHQPDDDAFDLLGQDRAIVVVDTYQGLHPDIVGRVAGTIVAGGALIMICPLLADWPDHADPQVAQLIPYPKRPKPFKSNYLARWSSILITHEGIELYTQNDVSTVSPVRPVASKLPLDQACTSDQQAAIEVVGKTVTGQRRRPAIITADRGRGKSATLGLAAAHLIAIGKVQKIVITSSGYSKVDTVFKHAQAALKNALPDRITRTLEHEQANIRYIAPDKLIHDRSSEIKQCDLLLIDEAASLGIANLKKLLIRFPRIAFATTEHGYEGSGRGFSLKFKQLIKKHCRGQHVIELATPIRWSDQDPLERWINQLLLLKTHDFSQPRPVPKLTDLQFEATSQASLVADETLLHRVFSLLVDAHYQTRPVDLRYLLDAPNSELWIAQANEHIIGLVWLMHEGGLDQEIANDIVLGRRRPQGHLVPQILAAHLGLINAATLRCARIQRIVVHPALQNKGIGQWMLDQLKSRIAPNTDYLASSFGVDLPLLRFWNQTGFDAVRLSDKANVASGLHSVVVIQSLTDAASRLQQKAQTVFTRQFPLQLAGSLDTLPPGLAAQLTKNKTFDTQIDQTTLEAAVLFAFAARPYESSLVAVRWLAKIALFSTPSKGVLSDTQRHLLIMRSLQNQGWAQCAKQLGISGKTEGVKLLRQGAQNILAHHCTEEQLISIKTKYHLFA